MTQPSFVPISEADQVRPARRLRVPLGWRADRPAEVQVPTRAAGRWLGTPGPDQGFALRLARRFEGRLQLGPGESAEDVVVGSALIAARRAGHFGRAPSTHEVEFALALFGFLEAGPPEELVTLRRRVFPAVGHDYDAQRALVDLVREEAFALTPAEVGTRVAEGRWKALLQVADGAPAPA